MSEEMTEDEKRRAYLRAALAIEHHAWVRENGEGVPVVSDTVRALVRWLRTDLAASFIDVGRASLQADREVTHGKLVADVEEARAMAVRLGVVCDRQGRLLDGAVTFDDAMTLFVSTIVADAKEAPNCWEVRGRAAGRGFVLSVQWTDGKTPQELLSEAMAARDTAKADAREALIAELEAMRPGFEAPLCGGWVVDTIVRRLRGEPEPEEAVRF